MSRLATLLAFFAWPATRQIAAFEHLPRDRGAPDFYTGLNRNPLLTLVDALCDEACHGDNEPELDFLARTALPKDTSRTAFPELLCYADLLRRSLCAEDYWTQRALRDKTAWTLFRRLAAQSLSDLRWNGDCSIDEVRQLVGHYQKKFAQP